VHEVVVVTRAQALRRANEKFTARFDAMKHAFTARGRRLGEATLEEMKTEWQRVKAAHLP
jgi:uncharacterized protein YabN with tetrapyrrole methylase and pyrophosphatase domain